MASQADHSQIKTVIDELCQKYAGNEYIMGRMQAYVCQQLPQLLETMQKTHEQRQQRIDELTAEQTSFIKSFLNNNQYFYNPSTEKFFYYDGKHYSLYSEDNILHHVLRTITADKQLMQWKQRTKVYIMKRIKENALTKTVPESETIQHVLGQLYPTIFATKTEAKYFLTMIGDNIFKKNTDLIHFLPTQAKHFIRELNTMCQGFLGTNLYQTIKHKYHEHNYQQCRIVNVLEGVKNETLWKSMLNACSLDMLCVACHYSTRFQDSDTFLLHYSNNNALVTDVMFLKNNSSDSVIQLFIEEYLQKNARASESMQINWKNMQYLWKHFLESKHLPAIIFQQTLHSLFVQKLDYKEDGDVFVNISSKYLPAMQKFVCFWDENMTVDETLDNEFEIDEICTLFKQWCGETVNNNQMIDLITYFYPDIEIESDKYIYNLRCAKWDKQLDINVALEAMKQEYAAENQPLTFSNYDAYLYYCKYFSGGLIVSKMFYDNHVAR